MALIKYTITNTLTRAKVEKEFRCVRIMSLLQDISDTLREMTHTSTHWKETELAVLNSAKPDMGLFAMEFAYIKLNGEVFLVTLTQFNGEEWCIHSPHAGRV